MKTLRERPYASLDRCKRFATPATCLTMTVLAATLAALAVRSRRQPVPSLQDARRNARRLVTRINPNSATRAELTVLPGIGEAKADRIVRFRVERRGQRSSQPVFRRARDLQRVPGIGPKTVEKLRPYLRFDPRSPSNPEYR